MGMFDTVNFVCPECHSGIPVQTKVGKCVLANIDALHTPIEIAASLAGREITCEECKTEFIVHGMLLPRRTPLELKKVSDIDETDDGYGDGW